MMNTNHRRIRRTLLGRFLPLAALLLAGSFIALCYLHGNDRSWMHLSPLRRVFAAGCLLLGTVFIELLVLRQMKFVSRGVATMLIVDDLRPIRWSENHLTAQYHFFTEDRRVISGTAAVHVDEQQAWTVGARVAAIYDPNRPARHAFVTRRLWATDWELNDDAVDADMDQAVNAMIAIHPRRAA